ncbi:unnamed protein product, partial [Polarella glacialis]
AARDDGRSHVRAASPNHRDRRRDKDAEAARDDGRSHVRAASPNHRDRRRDKDAEVTSSRRHSESGQSTRHPHGSGSGSSRPGKASGAGGETDEDLRKRLERLLQSI